VENIQTLLNEKIELERKIERARIDELERQRKVEEEKIAAQLAEIQNFRKIVQDTMVKYNLTEEQVLYGEDYIPKTKSNDTEKKSSLQAMRDFYSKL
jgi:hypothetical protein